MVGLAEVGGWVAVELQLAGVSNNIFKENNVHALSLPSTLAAPSRPLSFGASSIYKRFVRQMHWHGILIG